jgi:beta-glucuronidase
VTTPLVAISHLAIRATPRGDGADVQCLVELRNYRRTPFEGRVAVSVDAAASSREVCRVSCGPGRTASVTLALSLPEASRWSPDSPSLYTLLASLEERDATVDALSDRFGVRSVSVEGRQILLNGVPLRIRGVNRYDEYGALGRTVPESLVRADLLEVKRTGANLIRTHYPQDPIHHRIMDEIGLLLMQEVPLNWWHAEEEHAATVVDAAEEALRDMVRRDCNHPCVIAWSMANECKTTTPIGAHAMRRLMRVARALDPTRLVTYVADTEPAQNPAFAEADFVAVNVYYGLFHGEIARTPGDLPSLVRQPTAEYLRAAAACYPDRPLLVTEFGTHGIAGQHGGARFTEEYQAAYVRAVWEAIDDVPDVAGGVLWCWADYHHRRDFIGTGSALSAPYGPYGVVTIDRRPKASLATLSELFRADRR